MVTLTGGAGAGVGAGWRRRARAAAAGLVLDQLLGEPPVPGRWHPVALFGSAVGVLEDRLYDDRRANGVALAAAGAGLATAAGAAVRSPTLAGYLSTAGAGLHAAAGAVAGALDAGDLDRARALLPALVGRDPASLDAAGVARAAVESVAENTTDAIVAPALWTAAAGAPGAFLHRAADTLDSMVGYRDDRYRRFGTAAARLDDVLAWVPARATAALVALARPGRAGAVARTVRRDAGAHPSPNAGVAEAAFAAALGLRLGGDTVYGGRREQRPTLGNGRPPGPGDVRAAVGLSRHVTWLLAGALAVAGSAVRPPVRRSALGDGRPPGPGDVRAAVAFSRHVTWLLAGGLAVAGSAVRPSARRSVVADSRPPGAGDVRAAVGLSRHVTWLLAGGLAVAGSAVRPPARRR